MTQSRIPVIAAIALVVTFLAVVGGSTALVVLPQLGLEEAVRKKLRSENVIVGDTLRVEDGWCGEYLDPDSQDGVPDFQPFHAAKSANGQWIVTTRPEQVRRKCGLSAPG